MTNLQLSTLTRGEIVIICVGGELDAVTKAPLDRSLRGRFQRPGERVVLDLSDVTFMDSGSLGLITDHHQRAAAAGCELVLAGASPTRMQVLWLTGLADWLPLYPDADAACAALG
ncbi:STAS domain-containing protein [Nonomuraea sp. NPDC050310]|uniref:STAS domain-containing protein n=1 Tax=unclassified Nonomuraea TaxID=2593643 RepID=UPI0034017C55